jgi:hypothetical protein
MTKSESLNSDGSSARYLGYVVGGFVAAGVTFTLLRMLLPLLRVLVPVLIGWWLWRRWHKVQKSQQERLNGVFYQLIQEHEGRVTVLDFAMTAKLTAIAAREYLDARAKEFSAHFEVTERGDMFYLFPTLKASQFQPIDYLGKSLESDEQDESVTIHELTQAQLARRLGVSAGVVSRKKLSPDLSEWTKARDPDGVGWAYLAQKRRFFPADTDR